MRAPVADPFPAEEAPTPAVKRPAAHGAQHASACIRMLRNYDALSDENKRLVEALCLALRGTVDGGR